VASPGRTPGDVVPEPVGGLARQEAAGPRDHPDRGGV